MLYFDEERIEERITAIVREIIDLCLAGESRTFVYDDDIVFHFVPEYKFNGDPAVNHGMRVSSIRFYVSDDVKDVGSNSDVDVLSTCYEKGLLADIFCKMIFERVVIIAEALKNESKNTSDK